MSNTTTRICWNGWARSCSRRPWKLLVPAVASEDECRELLRQRTAGLVHVDLYVSATKDPNVKGTRR